MIADIRTGLHMMQTVELVLSGIAHPLLFYGPLPWALPYQTTSSIFLRSNHAESQQPS